MEEGFLGMKKLSKKSKNRKAEKKMKKRLYKQMKNDLKRNLEDEMSKLRHEEAMDEGYEVGTEPWNQKRRRYGHNEYTRRGVGRRHTHKLDDRTLNKLENDLEKNVLDDLQKFVEKVEAY
uniref:Uncharacterized protein n=1 Tax=Theileria annulata TaxID=5874 RepID=A0A3B0MQM2_THEAN